MSTSQFPAKVDSIQKVDSYSPSNLTKTIDRLIDGLVAVQEGALTGGMDLRLAAGQTLANADPVTHKLGDDCILCLPLREDAVDVGPNAFTVTNHGTVTFDAEDGASFDGSTQWLSIAADAKLEPAYSSLSMAFFVNVPSFPGETNALGGIGFLDTPNDGSFPFWVSLDYSADKYQVLVYNNDFAGVSTGYILDEDTRYHIGIVLDRDAAKARIYVDKVLIAEVDYDFGSIPQFNAELDLGRTPFGAGPDAPYLPGLLRDILYVGRAFSLNDIIAHCNDGDGQSDGGLDVDVEESVEVDPGAHSYQIIGVDLTLAAGAGSDDGTDPKFLAPIMGNVLGADLTKDSNYLAGVIGAYSITGTKETDYPTAAVMGVLFDGGQIDAIVLADLDGDDGGDATNARAFFGISVNNNGVGSGCEYGLDLYAESNANYTGGGLTGMEAITVAAIRFPNGQVFSALDTAITANVTLTALPAGSIGITSHATGKGKFFMSDGAKWQYAVVA